MIWEKLLLLSLAVGFIAFRPAISETFEFECVDEDGFPPKCGSSQCGGGTVCVNSCDAVSCNLICVEKEAIGHLCLKNSPTCPPGYVCTAAKQKCDQGSYLPTTLCAVGCGIVTCVPPTKCVIHFNPENNRTEHSCRPSSENAKPNRVCSMEQAATCPPGTCVLTPKNTVACVGS